MLLSKGISKLIIIYCQITDISQEILCQNHALLSRTAGSREKKDSLPLGSVGVIYVPFGSSHN